MTVEAFQPRRYDPPKFVAETEEELEELAGGYVGAGQCDGCGNSTYRIGTDQDGRWTARCAVDPSDDDEFKHPEPCGRQYLIRLYDDEEVEF